MKLSTHALDTASGRPAVNLVVSLVRLEDGRPDGDPTVVATDADGRHRFPDQLGDGIWRLRFEVGEYYRTKNTATLYPWADVVFLVEDAGSDHLHVPLLLSPFAYSTYRGS
ncbi:hydroxyisourate hydrolase [Corynebacterium pacaense]|uniref:hydroxyisourate hydrolase n=1 Tax=Corynebacterium pacaense TaxID=1816684 RepID=UPI0009BB6562|nr:hydroxyisourate hydrolase [Corynebacterium pacaense]